MKVIINGKPTTVIPGTSLAEVLKQFNLPPRSYVVEMNGSIVSHEQFSTVVMSDMDTVEIIRFVGGG